MAQDDPPQNFATCPVESNIEDGESHSQKLSEAKLLHDTLRDWLSHLDDPGPIIQKYRNRQAAMFEERCRRVIASGKLSPKQLADFTDPNRQKARVAFGLSRLRTGVHAHFVYSRNLLPTVVDAFTEEKDLRPDLTWLTRRQRRELKKLTVKLHSHEPLHQERIEAVAGQVYLAQLEGYQDLLSYPATCKQIDEIRDECYDLAPHLVQDKLRRSGSIEKTTKKEFRRLVKAYRKSYARKPPLSLAYPAGNIEAAYWTALAAQWPKTSKNSIREVPEEEWAENIGTNLALLDHATQPPVKYNNKHVLHILTFEALAARGPITGGGPFWWTVG